MANTFWVSTERQWAINPFSFSIFTNKDRFLNKSGDSSSRYDYVNIGAPTYKRLLYTTMTVEYSASLLVAHPFKHLVKTH